MKKRIIIWLAVILAAAAAMVFLFTRNTAEYVEKPGDGEVRAAVRLLSDALGAETMYCDYLESFSDPASYCGTGSAAATALTDERTGEFPEDSSEKPRVTVKLDYGESAEYIINAETDGLYSMQLEYASEGGGMSDYTVSLTVNGEQPYHEMKTIALPSVWRDETDGYAKDSYGDEMAPRQVRSDEIITGSLYSNTYCSDEPLLFELRAGENLITVTNVSADGLGLGRLFAQEPSAEPEDYESYIARYADRPVYGDLIRINAIDYKYKNTTEAICESGADPILTPYDVKNKLINTVNCTEPGTGLTYELEVPADGLYSLSFHYTNQKEEYDAFESIYIDGAIPFRELKSYAFAPTGSRWTNGTLSDAEGTPYSIYLTAGTHELTVKTEQEPVTQAWRYARLISEHVSQFSLEVKKIAGSDRDKYRTWKMTRYIPEIADYLDAYVTLINYIRYLCQDNATYGINSALLSDMDKSLLYIGQMREYPDEIALYTEKMTGRDSSLLVNMSNFTSEILKNDFTLDMIYAGDAQLLPDARAGALKKLGNGIKKLTLSFGDNKYSTKADDETLTIWVNRAVTHVDLLQKLADTEFTPETGIKVKISIMPDANKLTMSAAANETPDAALGLVSYMPFDLACRDALCDLLQFDDFWTVADRFVPGAFVPYVFNEGVYAVPETLDFHALVYRKDIYDSLGLTPPDTWQEVIDQLPELQRYGMNFYHNISSGVGYKWFYQTVPFIYQNNGSLYTEDGLSSAIDRPEAVKGMQALGNLFTAYSLDKQVNSFFNSFRYSILPVGIIDSNEYILLKNGAPELEGQWALAAYPGTEQEDGSITRWYVANGTGGVIFRDSEHTQEAWEFLKWWTDTETQVNYTYTLRSTYGSRFFWLPSNVEALEQAPIERADKDVILEQVRWLRDVPRTPGQYLVERSLSDIWNDMINRGTSAQVVIDEKTIAINREIKKKMKELDFLDENGNLIKPYVIRDVDWIAEQIENAR